MEYNKLITSAVQSKNWMEVIKLAKQAMSEGADESFFGIKTGYLNIIQTDKHSMKRLVPLFEDCNFKVYSGHYGVILGYIKSGKITEKTLSEKSVIITSSDSLVARLAELDYPTTLLTGICEYGKYDFKNNVKIGIDKYILTNKEGTTYTFDENTIKAVSREYRIDKIFED
jgi:hypothetical protein